MSEQNIVNISEANLQQTLQQSMNVPVLFYFWSARSQHCEQLTPVLERLAAQYNGQFTLAKVDCDAEQMLASQFGLRAIPTVYLFQNGQPVDGFEGPQPEEAIRALLDKVLPREEELKAQQALALMQEEKYADALPLLKEAWQLSNQESQIGLLLAETLIALHRSDEAESVLKTIPLQDQDTHYQVWWRRLSCSNRPPTPRKSSSCSSRWNRIRRMRSWPPSWRCSCIRSGVMKKRWPCCSAICRKI